MFRFQARVISSYPIVTLAVVIVITVLLGTGLALQESSGDVEDSFLPEGSRLQQAIDKIDEDFAASSNVVPVQIIARGNVLTPGAVQDTLDAIALAVADPEVGPAVATERPVAGFAHIVEQIVAPDAPGSLSQGELDSALETAAADPGPLGQAAASLESLVARNESGEVIGGLSIVNLSENEAAGIGIDELEDAQLRVEDVITGVDFAEIEARTSSSAKINQEINDATAASTIILMGAALLVILLVLGLFYRTVTDVAFSMLGLVVTLVWVFGLQGLLGPRGLDLIGPSGPTAIMVPVLLIGLTVDYALQVTGRYRESLSAGKNSAEAIGESVRHAGLPIVLAAGTTAISFFTNITNNLAPLRDFGIVAGLGVLAGWVVMTTFVPAVRTILDRRHERKGRSLQAQPLADAIPGVGAVIGRAADLVVTRPVPVLLVLGAITIAAGAAAREIDTTFESTDFLPGGTESSEDLEFLEDQFGGSTTSVTVLVEGDLLDDRLVRDLIDFEVAIRDENLRPELVTGPPTDSLFSLVLDLAEDTGLPGDLFDAQFAEFVANLDLGFVVPPEQIDAIYDELRDVAPQQTANLLALRRDQTDRTILRLPAVAGDQDQTRELVTAIEGLWPGEPEQLFLMSTEIVTVAITDDLTSSQTTSILLTIVAALIVLTIFFAITEYQPMLGAIAVAPIAMVVAWVLGSMWVLGISYNVMTALITALTIGVGVDYTIHITHRFLEEREHGSIRDAVYESMRTTGGALIGSALTTALGFGVLIFAPLAPMQQFGILTALTIVYSLIAAFLVLPPALVLWALYDRWRATEAASRVRPQSAP